MSDQPPSLSEECVGSGPWVSCIQRLTWSLESASNNIRNLDRKGPVKQQLLAAIRIFVKSKPHPQNDPPTRRRSQLPRPPRDIPPNLPLHNKRVQTHLPTPLPPPLHPRLPRLLLRHVDILRGIRLPPHVHPPPPQPLLPRRPHVHPGHAPRLLREGLLPPPVAHDRRPPRTLHLPHGRGEEVRRARRGDGGVLRGDRELGEQRVLLTPGRGQLCQCIGHDGVEFADDILRAEGKGEEHEDVPLDSGAGAHCHEGEDYFGRVFRELNFKNDKYYFVRGREEVLKNMMLLN